MRRISIALCGTLMGCGMPHFLPADTQDPHPGLTSVPSQWWGDCETDFRYFDSLFWSDYAHEWAEEEYTLWVDARGHLHFEDSDGDGMQPCGAPPFTDWPGAVPVDAVTWNYACTNDYFGDGFTLWSQELTAVKHADHIEFLIYATDTVYTIEETTCVLTPL